MLLHGPHWARLASGVPGAELPAELSGDAAADGEDSDPAQLLVELAVAVGENPANILPLVRFAASRDIAVETYCVPGGYLAMANIVPFAGDATSTTASGKGIGAVQAVLACLGEAAEISSWACRHTDVAGALPAAPSGRRIDARDVLGFSAAQVRNRTRLNKAWQSWDAIPPEDRLADPGHWVEVTSFDGERSALCPAFLCYGRFGDLAHGDASLNVDSNGCAAGPTPAEARTRALLELAERDATGIWWHNGTVRQRLDTRRMPDLHASIEQHRRDSGRRLWMLDISSFRSARTVAAVSCEDGGERLAFGFGAAFGLEDAARAAFLEVVQTEAAMIAHDMRRAHSNHATMSDGDCRMARWKRFADVRNFRFAIGTPPESTDAHGVGTTEDLLAEIRVACGQDVWFADLTRPDIGVPAAKAICSGLSHFKLRWGCGRNAAPQSVSTRTRGRLSHARKLLI